LQVALFQQLANNEFLSNLPSAALVCAYVGGYESEEFFKNRWIQVISRALSVLRHPGGSEDPAAAP